MSLKDNIDYSKIPYYVIIVLIVLGIIWLNYQDLTEHVSSNTANITEYQAPEVDMSKLRPPAVAGIFYPNDKQKLSEEVDHYLAGNHSPENKKPIMLIVPHAGYVYSAPTAARAYNQIKKYANRIKKVILVGPSHRVGFKGAAISKVDYFTTPLGNVSVNRELASAISKNAGFGFHDAPHAQEHSLEVQLPFLQKTLKNFSIVPIVYGDVEPEIIANALKPYLYQKDTLIIFSADLSHYHSDGIAREIDEKTAELIEKLEPKIDHDMSCGSTGINAALLLAKHENLYPELLSISNSGDTSGDKDRVVGYGAWMFGEAEEEEKPELPKLEQEVESLKDFTKMYGKDLLKLAYDSVSEAVLNDTTISISRGDYPNDMFNKGASFVTIYKNGELRGCIGTIVPHQAVVHDIAQNTYKAAKEDSRFSPIEPKELKDLTISISLLTDYEEIKYTDEADLLSKIKAGSDGIIIRDGNRQSVYLPSVWEQLPKKQEFLNSLKIKAGLSPTYWSNNIKTYRFRVVEISKHED